MAHSNPSLVPTVISDKHGKVTTVHKKNDMQQSSSVTKAPAPTLHGDIKSEKPSAASRIGGINDVLAGGSWGKARQTKAAKLVKFSTPEQLDILDEALAGFDGGSDREQSVLAAIFDPLTHRTGPTGAIHELLAHRKAFASEWAVKENPPLHLYGLEPFVHGLREDNFRAKLDCTDESVVNGNIALIRFAYEVRERAPHGGFLPVYEAQIGVGGATTAYAYESDDLKTLIAENADRVDSLIDLALTHKTSDAQRLRALLEHEGHSSLTYGML
jgi:hypothetical protein